MDILWILSSFYLILKIDGGMWARWNKEGCHWSCQEGRSKEKVEPDLETNPIPSNSMLHSLPLILT